MSKTKPNKPVIENRKAKHNYFIEKTIECGIVLKGNEIKSIISGKANINEAWCEINENQLILNNMYIAKYDNANKFDVDERRTRTLLAHKNEIKQLYKSTIQDGYTLIPLKVFWNRQYAKILIGVCKGKHTYDKRESLKQKDIQRQMERYKK